jgi:hypothetical protein
MSTRGCSRWQEIMALDAVGQAEPGEVRGLEEHLEGCIPCRLDVREVRVAGAAIALVDPTFADTVDDGPDGPARAASKGRSRGRRGAVAVAVGVAAVAAALVALVVVGAPTAPSRATNVALRGETGVSASIDLTTQPWGTRATLHESGQPAGTTMTVAMRSESGRWWVAGSYRTPSRPGSVVVQLSCAVPLKQITDVWVTNQHGRMVLDGYVH